LIPVPATAHVPIRNRILSKLAKAEYRRLRPSLEQVALHENQVLYGPGDTVDHVYFPNDAVVSLLFDVNERRTVEVAMEGNEGAVGLAIYLGGVNACNLSVVRQAGTAMRMDVNALTKCANQRGDLQELLRRYIHALVTHDRMGSSELHATQESIAHMLGVRRSSVTAAASGFHKQHIIDYRRGRIAILDRRKLRAACCDCYAMMKRQYDSFLN
jgi:CRP-like cAMP-binding protein